MESKNIWRTAGGLVLAAGLLGGGMALAAGGSSRSAGPDFTYGAANPFADATAAVHVIRTGAEGTQVTLHVTGVNAPRGTTFGAHVHKHSCGSDPLTAEGHYQHSQAGANLVDREVWLDFTVNATGNGHAEARRPWLVDESQQRSVIIHAIPTRPSDGFAGPRLACIDLDGAT